MCRQNCYDGVDEFYVMVKESGQHAEEESQEEIRRKRAMLEAHYQSLSFEIIRKNMSLYTWRLSFSVYNLYTYIYIIYTNQKDHGCLFEKVHGWNYIWGPSPWPVASGFWGPVHHRKLWRPEGACSSRRSWQRPTQRCQQDPGIPVYGGQWHFGKTEHGIMVRKWIFSAWQSLSTDHNQVIFFWHIRQTKNAVQKFLDSLLQKGGKLRGLIRELKDSYQSSPIMQTQGS